MKEYIEKKTAIKAVEANTWAGFRLEAIPPLKITDEDAKFALSQMGAYFAIKIRDKKEGEIPAELYEKVQALRQYVVELESMNMDSKWIPVDVDTPDPWELVWATYHGKVYVLQMSHKGHWVDKEDEYFCDVDGVTAWQPYYEPEPYREKRSEDM